MKKLNLAAIFAVVMIFTFGLTAPALADPIIEVVPMEHDFGDVEVGSSAATIITISNINGHDLIVTAIGSGAGSSTEFAITMAPALPALVLSGAWVDVEVTFSPSSDGYASAVLEIESNDPINPGVSVDLCGGGIAAAPPTVTIDDILAFFDQSVADGTLFGNGPGKSARGRIKAMRNKLKATGDLIDGGYIEQACRQLLNAYQRCDGLRRPPEFVAGPAAPTLAHMILDLMVGLGCE